MLLPLLLALISAEPADLGRDLFMHEWVPGDSRSHAGDGLGPVYNAASCVACHPRGGASPEGDIEIITASSVSTGNMNLPNLPGFSYDASFDYDSQGGFSAQFRRPTTRPAVLSPSIADLSRIHPGFRDAPGVVLHRYGNAPAYRGWRSGVVGQHGSIVIRSSRRNPTSLFGVGLIDSIPSSAIEEAARESGGHVSRLPSGKVGRFGWKAQVASLRDFVIQAAAVEMGISTPGHPQSSDPIAPRQDPPGLDLSAEDCDALVSFVGRLPAPLASSPRGIAQFHAVGCARCHRPFLANVGLYSDLSLHRMSGELSDTSSYAAFGSAPPFSASGRGDVVADEEWRTPPLWGVADSAPYMHDGRAGSLDDAIRLHGGEASASARRYRQLSESQRAELLAFLMSLEAPK